MNEPGEQAEMESPTSKPKTSEWISRHRRELMIGGAILIAFFAGASCAGETVDGASEEDIDVAVEEATADLEAEMDELRDERNKARDERREALDELDELETALVEAEAAASDAEAAASAAEEEDPPSDSSTGVPDTSDGMWAFDLLWAGMSPAERNEFCDAYDLLGPEFAYESFRDGYGADAPSLSEFRRFFDGEC